VVVLEQQSRLFENSLLAGSVDVHQHIVGGKNGGKSVHRVAALITAKPWAERLCMASAAIIGSLGFPCALKNACRVEECAKIAVA
jgi:hypothetical protein